MNKYQINLRHSDLIEAKDEDEAIEKYFENNVECSQQTPTTFISENLKVERAYLASELKGDALQKVLEKNNYINVEDSDWAYRDEAPFLDIKEFGLEVDEKRMCWNLEHPYRQLFFDNAHDGSGNTQIGIWIADLDKLVKRLKKDLKLSAQIVKAMKDGEIELSFGTQLFGGGDGKTYFEYEDRTENEIVEKYKLNLDEILQNWFEDEVVKHLLNSFQRDYDYLTSEKAIVESLDANELLFSVEGESL